MTTDADQIRVFLKKTNSIKNRIHDLQSEIHEIQQELHQFLQTLGDAEREKLRDWDSANTASADASSSTEQEQVSTNSTGGASDTRQSAPIESEGQKTSSYASEQPSETTQDPEEKPKQPPTSTEEAIAAVESDLSSPSEEEESGQPLDPSTVESGEEPSPDSRSYQKRMIRKDPRLKSLPDDVLDALARFEELFVEVDRGIQFLDALSIHSRSSQIAIWAGTARKYQDIIEEWEADIPDEFLRKIKVFFGKLTTVTRDLDCDWIDALKRSYETDWNKYIKKEKSNLKQNLQREKRVREFLKEPPKERKQDRKVIRRRLRELAQQEDTSAEEAKSVLSEGMDLLVLDEPALVKLAKHFYDELEDDKFDPLKKVVEEQTDMGNDNQDEGDEQEVIPRPTLGPTVKDEVLNVTRDKRAMAIGEQVSKVWKNRIRDAFKMRSLDWYDPEEQDDDAFHNLKNNQSLQNMDYILILKSRLNTDFSKVKNICDSLSPKTLVIEGGAGIAPIRNSLQNQVLTQKT